MLARTRVLLALGAALVGIAAALPMSLSTSASGPPIKVGVTRDGQVCYATAPDYNHVHCTG